jgi:DNA-binding transcriptional regulator YhcF (GntR family)
VEGAPIDGNGVVVILRVDPEAPVPPYEQIRAQVERTIASGVLPAGARLPSIRQLARDLGVAGGTVARAYRELERDGLIGGRGRHGTFVLDGARAMPAEERRRELRMAAEGFAVAAARLGVDPRAAVAAAERAVREVATAG